MSVIDFKTAKEQRQPHVSGEARCLQCDHEWVATAPAGEKWLACPTCQTHKGAFVGNCYPSEGLVWECQCGNELFLITPEGDLCPVCGVYQDD